MRYLKAAANTVRFDFRTPEALIVKEKTTHGPLTEKSCWLSGEKSSNTSGSTSGIQVKAPKPYAQRLPRATQAVSAF